MKNRTCRKHQDNKKMICGKRVAGVDPAKEKHQVTVLDGQVPFGAIRDISHIF